MARLKYHHDWKTIKEHTVLNQHQKSAGLGNVQDAIEQFMGKDAYAGINKIDEKNHDRALHASRGDKLMKSGRNVLEIDIGGSGYEAFRAKHKGLSGKEFIEEDGMTVSHTAIRKKKFKKAGLVNKIGFLQKLPKFMRPMSEKEISKYNDIIVKYSAKVPMEQVRQARKNHPEKTGKKAPRIKNATVKTEIMMDRIIRETYGESLGEDEFSRKIRIKNQTWTLEDGHSVRKTRWTMPGPLASSGMRDAGDFSIDKLRDYTLDIGKNYLTPLFEKWSGQGAKSQDIKPVTISLRGHSRGAVAASHGAMKIKYWIHENYPQFEKYVDFELTQHDPVPGYFSDSEAKNRINICQSKTPEDEDSLKKLQMMPLGDRAETTVIYSMHTEHPLFFSPQNVRGAKRVIFVPEEHSVNLDAVDKSQGKSHRGGYTDASTGEVYRNSGLNELPEGVYFADEKQRMVRMTDPQMGHRIFDEVTKSAWGQSSRHRRLNRAIDNWFADAKEREALRAKNENKWKKMNFDELSQSPEEKEKSSSADKTKRTKKKEKQKDKEKDKEKKNENVQKKKKMRVPEKK